MKSNGGLGRTPQIIMVTVTVVWGVSTLLDAAVKTYSPSPIVHTIMLAVVGIIGAIYGIKKRNGHDE